MRFLTTFQIHDFIDTLVSTAVNPSELNRVVVDLQHQPGVKHVTWEVSTTD